MVWWLQANCSPKGRVIELWKRTAKSILSDIHLQELILNDVIVFMSWFEGFMLTLCFFSAFMLIVCVFIHGICSFFWMKKNDVNVSCENFTSSMCQVFDKQVSDLVKSIDSTSYAVRRELLDAVQLVDDVQHGFAESVASLREEFSQILTSWSIP